MPPVRTALLGVARLRLTLLGLAGLALVSLTGAARPPKGPAAPLHVAEVIARAPVEGRLTITGYVARIYLCPSCPAGAVCKPCVGDHVVLSDERHALGPGDDLGATDVLIAGERAALQGLRAGARYDVDVEVQPTRGGGRAINDLRLVGARPRS
jgi:hypothetical protein